MTAKKVDKIKIEYKYPEPVSVKHAAGYSANYSSAGFVILNFYTEHPSFISESDLVFYDDGHMLEVERDKEMKIIRNVESTVKLDFDEIKQLSQELNDFVEEIESDIDQLYS